MLCGKVEESCFPAIYLMTSKREEQNGWSYSTDAYTSVICTVESLQPVSLVGLVVKLALTSPYLIVRLVLNVCPSRPMGFSLLGLVAKGIHGYIHWVGFQQSPNESKHARAQAT